MTATSERLRLRRPTAGLESLGEFEPIGPPERLAPLMLAAYRGTPDDEGESLQDTVDVLADAMRGGFGLWLPAASFVALEGGEPVGAALTALHDDEPFIAFLFTAPDASGRGVGARLVGRVCQALANDGYDSVALWVGVANKRAARLYRHLGFVDAP
ncbi:MAG: GNAT family N-acetyltransferase [Cellulomonadaceae bacterium]|nr:GNAT family N-acetyltransferase [Cellulomonadaceae bacterium]